MISRTELLIMMVAPYANLSLSRLAQLVERVTSILCNDEVSRSSRLMGNKVLF